MISRFGFCIAIVMLPSIAHSCAVCDSQVGVAVRAGIFNAAFFPTFLQVFAPFPLLGVAMYTLNRFLPD
jgi:hypothetical protein